MSAHEERGAGDRRLAASLARRDLLRLAAGAALVAGGAPGCARAQRETLRPFVRQPAELVPGNPLFFATSIVEDGYATGLVVESHEGRPTKIEGNPRHPASLGGTSAVQQASLLGLYDPDRASAVTRAGAPSSWRELSRTLADRVHAGGVRVLLEASSSPVVADRVAKLRALAPAADVRWFGPLAPVAEWEGARIAFDRPLEPRVDLRQAGVVVSLDSDFLCAGPGALRLARDFAGGRAIGAPSDRMNRLYAVEPSLSPTGMSADHRLRVRARDVLSAGASLAVELANEGVPLPSELVAALSPWAARAAGNLPWVRALARDLAASRGRSVVLVGSGQPPEVHALAHALNAALGNAGHTVTYAPSALIEAGSDSFDLAPLFAELEAGNVGTLVIAGGNPAYRMPADVDFARRIARAKESVYLGAYVDETARACTWNAPKAHFLESWGDARAFDGTLSLIQPLLATSAERYTTLDLLAGLLGEAHVRDHQRLVSYWRSARADFASWDEWLEAGFIPGTEIPPVVAPVKYGAVRDAIARTPLPEGTPTLELCARPDHRVRDGEHTNNAWLMELPDPVTRQTWGNAALLSAATAGRLSVRTGDVVRLERAGRSVRATALIAPGQADDVVSLALGYGRTGDGEELARGVGANANVLRSAASPWFATGLTLAPTGERDELALGQEQSSLEGRDDEVLLHRTLDAYRRDPNFASPARARHLALYDLPPRAPHQWGMVIDLNSCTGCAACVVACQAENNVPSVGKAGVAKGRAMHWIRIDRYFAGEPDDPRVLLEPMACQHCEKAPCEYVCPVNATTHSADGLNQMVYNRCVGTRFCSNNCPYKVRRFNWFNYHAGESMESAAIHNPDVTVRARGVMEKCTYCVQRIREAEIGAEVARRPMADGDVVTACEAACPSRAITFGDTANPTSRVSRLRASPRGFSVLGALGTRPRTLYLARITNPNPEIA